MPYKLYGILLCDMDDPFHNRLPELATLERAWAKPGAGLVLVWGRRRTGKTRLLGRFAQEKPAIFYGATQQSAAAELRAFSEVARAALSPAGTDLLAHQDFESWDTAFDYLGQRATSRRLLVVLDEFSYLVDSDPSLPSILQRFWDHAGRNSKLMIVLCGSVQASMLDLQERNAPLFSRFDNSLHVQPFSFSDSALFNPSLQPADQACVFAVLGGMPMYLSRWDAKQGRDANLRGLFGDPASPLVQEGEFALTSELPDAAGYFRIMHGIASGHRTFKTLQDFAAIDIKRQLDRLIELGLVTRDVPATEDPARSKRVIYRIGDNFLHFWFKFIYRHTSDVARGMGRGFVDNVVLPAMNDYMGDPWEEMCRDFLRVKAARGELPVEVSSLGRWWNRDNSVEIDVVGMRGRKVVLAGSVKWSSSVGRSELNRLRAAVEALPDKAADMRLALFARDHVRGVEPAEASSFTAADLFP